MSTATAHSPALDTLVGIEWVGRHADDGLIAHWAPNSTGSYYLHTSCALPLTVARPFTAVMHPCPACFSADRVCVWCGVHCDVQLRRDHLRLTGLAQMAGKPTLMPDGTLRAAADLTVTVLERVTA